MWTSNTILRTRLLCLFLHLNNFYKLIRKIRHLKGVEWAGRLARGSRGRGEEGGRHNKAPTRLSEHVLQLEGGGGGGRGGGIARGGGWWEGLEGGVEQLHHAAGHQARGSRAKILSKVTWSLNCSIRDVFLERQASYSSLQCCGSLTFWYGYGYGSGSADPYNVADKMPTTDYWN